MGETIRKLKTPKVFARKLDFVGSSRGRLTSCLMASRCYSSVARKLSTSRCTSAYGRIPDQRRNNVKQLGEQRTSAPWPKDPQGGSLPPAAVHCITKRTSANQLMPLCLAAGRHVMHTTREVNVSTFCPRRDDSLLSCPQANVLAPNGGGHQAGKLVRRTGEGRHAKRCQLGGQTVIVGRGTFIAESQ